ncbi:hypothetical protein BFP97_04415 [Roseivirga sp. 4D4]|uniref:hypothetical protein n=1 Tax=Roseivirga sp. 4D4 TaxID=1889784 RepID=UPI0008530E8E|nr:hypothetical protein [Roseivirga sp. 4D4]OEK00797.1 hypothetical protein BFP97_04415 [Roseivirga sp. 4D4]
MKNKSFLLLVVFALVWSHQAEAQLFKRKKKKTNVSGLVIEEAPDLEKEERKFQRRLVNPIRKTINRFNFSIEKGVGYFSYRNPLNDVSVIRDPRGDQLYIVPLDEEQGLTSPINAFNNWFTDLTPIGIERIDDDSHIVRTDTSSFTYNNNGRINPLTFRFSISLKKLDKGHYERTKEKIYLDDDMIRIGGGIGFGGLRFRNPASTQDVSSLLRGYTLPETKLSTTKLFASLSYNMYTIGDYSIHADVLGGVWKVKAKQVNTDVVNYDPFFNIGVMFQMKFSKYFKGYIRPSFELRSYTVSNDLVNIQHKFSVFTIDLGLLFKYPIYPRNKYQADQVQMEHIFNNKIYRGRPFYRKQNPRFGQNRIRRKPIGSSFPRARKNKSRKGN